MRLVKTSIKDFMCNPEKATSKRRWKRSEIPAGSFATDDAQRGIKSRKRDGGQLKTSSKKIKARKSQFERRNIR